MIYNLITYNLRKYFEQLMSEETQQFYLVNPDTIVIRSIIIHIFWYNFENS